METPATLGFQPISAPVFFVRMPASNAGLHANSSTEVSSVAAGIAHLCTLPRPCLLVLLLPRHRKTTTGNALCFLISAANAGPVSNVWVFLLPCCFSVWLGSVLAGGFNRWPRRTKKAVITTSHFTMAFSPAPTNPRREAS